LKKRKWQFDFEGGQKTFPTKTGVGGDAAKPVVAVGDNKLDRSSTQSVFRLV
jgi:hypothetical protein